MRLLALLVLALLPLTSGCVSGGADFHVRIDLMGETGDGVGYGHGILLDSTTVVTVNHVAPKQGLYLVSRASAHRGHRRRIRYVRADFVRSYNDNRSVETFSVLKLRQGMVCSRFPKFRNIEPGDSGSPIFGKRGAVVGLVTGMKPNMFFMGRIVRGWAIIGSNGPVGPTPRKREE